jgi:hypothetical protein
MARSVEAERAITAPLILSLEAGVLFLQLVPSIYYKLELARRSFLG